MTPKYQFLGEFTATHSLELERHVVISRVDCPSRSPRLQDVDVTGKWKNIYINFRGGATNSANRSDICVKGNQIVNDENDNTVKSSPIGANGSGVGNGGGLVARLNESLTVLRGHTSKLNCFNGSNESDDTKGVATTTATGHCRTSDSVKNSSVVEKKKRLNPGFFWSGSKKKLSPTVSPKSGPVEGGSRTDVEEDVRKENIDQNSNWFKYWNLNGGKLIQSSWIKEYGRLKSESASVVTVNDNSVQAGQGVKIEKNSKADDSEIDPGDAVIGAAMPDCKGRDWAATFDAHCDAIYNKHYQDYCKKLLGKCDVKDSKAAGSILGGILTKMKDDSKPRKTEDKQNLDAGVVDPQKEKSSPNSGIKKGFTSLLRSGIRLKKENTTAGQSNMQTERGDKSPGHSGTGRPTDGNIFGRSEVAESSGKVGVAETGETDPVKDFLKELGLEYSPPDEGRQLKLLNRTKPKTEEKSRNIPGSIKKGNRSGVNNPPDCLAEPSSVAEYLQSIQADFAAMTVMPAWMQEDPEVWKYWFQRYKIFEKFDAGVQLDREAWYSTTMEPLARHIAERCKGDRIVDAFCGAGGNAIQFARKSNQVIAIDKNPGKIEMARHNANIYGISENVIMFKEGDFLELADKVGEAGIVNAVFVDPPWGGPKYVNAKVCDIGEIDVDCFAVMEAARKLSDNIALQLPRNANVDQIIQLARPGEYVEIEQNYVNGGLKSITVYFGDLVEKPSSGNP